LPLFTFVHGIYLRVDEITAGKKENNGKKEDCFHLGRKVSAWKCSTKLGSPAMIAGAE